MEEHNERTYYIFSRADENYFGGSLKYIEKGNTEVVAEKADAMTGADLFKVEPVKPYSADYNTCIEQAKKTYKAVCVLKL